MASQFVWRFGVLREIASSPEIQRVVLGAAKQAASQASSVSGQPYIVDSRVGTFRVNSKVKSLSTPEAFFAEVRTNALARVHPKI